MRKQFQEKVEVVAARLGVSCIVQFSEAFVPSFLEVPPSPISSCQVWLFAQVTVTGSTVAEKLSF